MPDQPPGLALALPASGRSRPIKAGAGFGQLCGHRGPCCHGTGIAGTSDPTTEDTAVNRPSTPPLNDRSAAATAAGHSAASLGETGTDTDAMPPPLGTGRPSLDTGGIPQTMDAGAAGGQAVDSAGADMAVDAGTGAIRQAGGAAADVGDAEPVNEKPEEQLARPARR